MRRLTHLEEAGEEDLHRWLDRGRWREVHGGAVREIEETQGDGGKEVEVEEIVSSGRQ